jgi:hypothetical protein
VVASSNYLDVENAEPFIEFLVRQCCLDADSDGTIPGKVGAFPSTHGYRYRKSDAENRD